MSRLLAGGGWVFGRSLCHVMYMILVANVVGACATGTARVGSTPAGASPYGALDMAGNAAEWVNDWFDYEYYAQSPERNPPGPESATSRVVRGGNWDSIPGWISCFHRDGWEPDVNFYGFRCATPAGAGG